ncbi:phytanoyl-CoA dioxygenase family protein [Paraburkholderia sp. Ac-20336]|uniref:phytanoyl-CoA dioxygenase family protein n=1 Tax=Paraburkholderia sp. Ac-20336 TaxID=2703886 RepID=UPI00197E95EE|nr:phytanoyl-CoA dioxygenase family protein [Paraburkholderia sp. Ac-20336]
MNSLLKKDFDENGVAILPGFYSSEQIDEVVDSIARRKLERPMNVTVDLLDTGERSLLGLLSPQEIATRRMKINDLYLDMEGVRELALSDRLALILGQLLEYPPALCNSLYFEKGSQQPPHVDSIYMTPVTANHLIAIWVALEDTHVDAGQLEYYPGSHKIEPMIFSNGTRHFVPDEMPEWHAYIEAEVAQHGFTKQVFPAKKGDVLIWHANLLHGGSPIADPSRTRKSLVFHYFSTDDVTGLGMKQCPMSSGFWIDRPIQHVPEEAFKRASAEDAYLARYPDVARAVSEGHFASGLQHYELFGKAEGRTI